MKLSLNWIRQLTSVDLPTEKLAEKIGAQLGAVDGIADSSQKYQGIVVVKVISCVKHPNADKLSVCLVDDGGKQRKVKRDKAGLIEIVCGAPNVKAGMLAAWLPPGATVPSTYDKEPLVLEAREIRGAMSNGMLASAKELDIGDDHTGIVEIDKAAKPGDDFAELYKMNDFIIDIENKMFTHRPDLFGALGLAREIAGIQGHKFRSPDWYREDAGLPADGRKNVLKLSVNNDTKKLVPRFCAVAIKDVKVAPSPLWLRSSLSRLGVKSINNIVDMTNFYMLLSAQPLHAYDYDKVKTGVLGVRLSKKGEKLALLNGKEITFGEGAVVITDGKRPIGLGGIMGGTDTEVDEKTKHIILESANFDMNRTRQTAMEYGLFTDAATRFTKNQSPRQNLAVLCKAAEDIRRLAGGRQASPVIDDKNLPPAAGPVKVTPDFINSRLGLYLKTAEIKKMLENVEFKVDGTHELKITAPFWRTDIEIPEDIVEEVGRLYGYDKLPVKLPPKNLAPAGRNTAVDFKTRLRDILSRAGANEVLTYSFVHERLFNSVGQVPAHAYHIRNAVSPDLQYYRLSLTPSLLDKVHANQRAGFKEFALFELGLGRNQKMKDPGTKLPVEFPMLSLVYASSLKSAKNNGAAYYQAKKTLAYLLHELDIKPDYRPIPAEEVYPVVKPFDHTRSSQVWDKKTNAPLGMVGEYKPMTAQSLKLPAYSAGFEIGIGQLMAAAPPKAEYQPLNRFPSSNQDICLRLPVNVNFGKADGYVRSQLKKLTKKSGYGFDSEPIDIFQKPADKQHHQITWRLSFWHPEKTLTTDEVNKLLDELSAKAKIELKAERV
ncbi:MAG TPA: phenylalanine--tRNA ligase subunit beta [Candidatus Saccharimonadales bacterium]|nr:phenylalanine--tRNA ligase subunit beta [Candidatus Saccharimonadales bacterium]